MNYVHLAHSSCRRAAYTSIPRLDVPDTSPAHYVWRRYAVFKTFCSYVASTNPVPSRKPEPIPMSANADPDLVQELSQGYVVGVDQNGLCSRNLAASSTIIWVYLLQVRAVT